MSVEETEQTLTDPNERILKQITVEDVENIGKSTQGGKSKR